MLKASFAVYMLCALMGSANAATASDELILKFMEVSNVRATLDGMRANADNALKNNMLHSLGYQQLNDKQKKIAEEAGDKAVKIQQENLSYDAIVKLILPLYRRTFTQEELQAAIKFYSSPEGKSINQKMPLLANDSMKLTAEVNQKVIPQYQKIALEAAERIKQSK
ncbi:DUF2059 domain-containing protein [Methylobacillus gramineus]|uniref:DUF2059 domain-containing protein n=1 Tax=Methylobacillus gramineus TaxID=755169 RepID=UPI001CFF92D8|nr:DUF2059 domain-containing protein [Methylobacillus gramineus]MCB5184231.1 DUF2059 domain-containing protein [Methylobacillus gramineus]